MPAAGIYLILLQGGQYGHLWGPLGGRVFTQHFDGEEPNNSTFGVNGDNASRGIEGAKADGNPPVSITRGEASVASYRGAVIASSFGGKYE